MTTCSEAVPRSEDRHEPAKDPIYQLLFPDSAPIYAVLDAAAVPNLPEMLEVSGLQHACLFSGEAEDDLGPVAPWLVQLEVNNAFTRNLLTDSDTPAPWHMWGYEPGLFIRSAQDFSTMRRHLRKFTRVRDDTGAWFFMRFWSTDFLFEILRQPGAERMPFLRSFFRPGVIDGIVGHNVFDNVISIDVGAPSQEEAGHPVTEPILNRADLEAIGSELANRRAARVFARDYPAILNSVPMPEIRDRIAHARAMAQGMKIDRDGLVGHFILFGVVYAPSFWEDPGFVAYWNDVSIAPNDRFQGYLDAVKAQARSTVPEFQAWW